MCLPNMLKKFLNNNIDIIVILNEKLQNFSLLQTTQCG
jgi:hypothetical protein